MNHWIFGDCHSGHHSGHHSEPTFHHSYTYIILTFDAQLGGSRSSRNPEEQLPRLGLEHSMPLAFCQHLQTLHKFKVGGAGDLWTLLFEGCHRGADLSDLPRFQGYAQLMTFYGALLISGWIGMICHYAACQIMPVLMVDLRCFAWSQFPEAFSRAPLMKQDEGGHLENGSRKKCTYTSCVNAFKVIKGPIRSVHSCRPGILGTFIGYWVSSSDASGQIGHVAPECRKSVR